MELHNSIKGTVISEVKEVFETLKKKENPGKFCTCDHCRMDVICYVLNRTPPRYIVSNRGAARVLDEGLGWQQQTADITSLIYEGLNKVNQNLRPNIAHSLKGGADAQDAETPKFNIPTIMGRIFNGNNFAPLSGVDVELLWEGELVAMKDANWQNPFHIVSNVEGNFSFWPAPVPAGKVKSHKIFEYTLRVTVPEFETLNHTFKVPVSSEIDVAGSFDLDRTFKLPDIYMFPPGEAEKNGYLD
jgi:competence protein ComFB